MSANNSQGIYTQLPQSLSDSDSEHEINDLKEVQPGQRLHRTHTNGQPNHHHHLQFNLPQHVVHRVDKKWPKGFRTMSPARRLAFIASILVCILVIVVFLWVLPCSAHGTCPTRIGSWKVEHEGIELRGRINVINGRYKKSVNLALLAKKSLNSNYDGSSTSGAIALKSATGQISWFLPQVRTPSEMVCDLIDVNEDSVDDCLLLSEMGLQALDALSGAVIWHGHNTKMIIPNMDFPILLPDLNKDNLNELLSVTDSHNAQHNKLIIICGRTGSLLTSFTLHMCDDINDYKYDDKLVLFNCFNASHNNYYKIHVGDLQKKIVNQTFPVQATKIQYEPQHETEYILSGHKLEVQNVGKCPDCHTNIGLVHLAKDNKRLLGWSRPRAYAMRPIPYSFKNTRKNAMYLKGHLNGFVMKLWQWTEAPSVSLNGSTIKRNALLEKVLLISFSDTDFQVINVSMVSITQLCFPTGLDCQPALMQRNDSLLLTDLDMDGAQELINYSSSYKCGEEDATCHLVSRMEVVQLETEMAKLYAK